MSLAHIVGLLKSSTALSGTLSAFDQRAYVIVGRPAFGVAASTQIAYLINGAVNNGIAVRQNRAYAIVGMAPPSVVGVSQQRAYAIVYP